MTQEVQALLMPRSTARIPPPAGLCIRQTGLFLKGKVQIPDPFPPVSAGSGRTPCGLHRDGRCNQHPLAEADLQPVPGIADEDLDGCRIRAGGGMNMLSQLYMAGYTYPRRGSIRGSCPRVHAGQKLPSPS